MSCHIKYNRSHLLRLFPEGTAAGDGEAALGPVEDWFRGEFKH